MSLSVDTFPSIAPPQIVAHPAKGRVIGIKRERVVRLSASIMGEQIDAEAMETIWDPRIERAIGRAP